ncbi:unnamed protein product [Cylindrotheca closterium]|uniref:Uncharacterized protein n=1 Tax=Cylindrotheca closterium TaxID=2856 RepID=A0AAD2CBU3_9STRA|nr:unnamed protein product [Cylindrotheca closterium]
MAASVEQEIEQVGEAIARVEREIEEINEILKSPTISDDDKTYHRQEKSQLRQKESQLRQKEDRLRQEKLLLIERTPVPNAAFDVTRMVQANNPNEMANRQQELGHLLATLENLERKTNLLETPTTPWVGRKATRNSIECIVESNFSKRQSTDHAQFAFLVASGHVRSGKTRTGIELPGIIDRVFESKSLDQKVLPTVYLKIDFLNGSKFNAQFDTPRRAPSEALGGRLLLSYFDISVLQPISHDFVMGQILRHVLRHNKAEANVVVPVVIHFDEHGEFIADRNKSENNSDGRNFFLKMLQCLGSLATSNDSAVRDWHRAGSFFLVPITTGTSSTDANFTELSKYQVHHLALPVLDTATRKKMAAECLQGNANVDKNQISNILENDLFQVALADTGGLPGLVEFACEYNFQQGNSSPVQHLHLKVAAYVNKKWDAKMKSIVSASLSRIRVSNAFVLMAGTDTTFTVQSALDGGTIFLQNHEIRLAPAVLGKFTNDNDMLHSLILKAPTRADPWTWQSFEKVHLLYLAATMGAMVKEREQFKDISLRTYLRNLQPAGNSYLSQKLVLPLEFQSNNYIEDERQCISNQKIRVTTEDHAHVHLAKAGTPIVDGYLNVKVLGGKRLTIFLQYKHSELLSSNARVNVSHMNEAAQNLDHCLDPQHGWDVEGDWIFVWVTNREVIQDVEAIHERLLWVDSNSLCEHCPLIGERGLVARENT